MGRNDDAFDLLDLTPQQRAYVEVSRRQIEALTALTVEIRRAHEAEGAARIAAQVQVAELMKQVAELAGQVVDLTEEARRTAIDVAAWTKLEERRIALQEKQADTASASAAARKAEAEAAATAAKAEVEGHFRIEEAKIVARTKEVDGAIERCFSFAKQVVATPWFAGSVPIVLYGLIRAFGFGWLLGEVQKDVQSKQEPPAKTAPAQP